MHKRFLSISGQTDDELLILLQKGNERAFTTIYERYHKLLYVVAFKYLRITIPPKMPSSKYS